MLEINNITVCCDLNVSLNINYLAKNLWNVEYAPNKFSGIHMRFKDPNGTCMVFRNGKVIALGQNI
jgi:TATA-box binding protein (TBP) (component of TFIID and TFIIIB)